MSPGFTPRPSLSALALADTGLVLPHPHRKHLAYLPFCKVLRDHDIAAVSRSRR